MPQDSIFPTDPRYTGLRVTMTEVYTSDGPRWDLLVTRRSGPTEWKAVASGTMSGIQMDFLATLYSECATAFMWGEPRDLSRAFAGVLKAARAHEREHTY